MGVSQHPDNGLAALDAFKESVGRYPAIWSLWSSWGGSNSAFPDLTLMNGLRFRGVVPQFFWEPDDPSTPPIANDPLYTYRSIIAGTHDAYVREWARDAKEYGGTILLKFAHEMNADWFPWGVGRPDNGAMRFKKAWRRIHNLIRGPGGEGATNVKLLWSVYGSGDKSLYPGDAYVHYVGFSTFNWGGGRSMKQLFAPPVNRLKQFTNKKIIVTETGTPSFSDKAGWITVGYPEVYKAFPQIAAIVYFDVAVYGQPDWRLTEPSHALTAYASIVAKPTYQGRIR